MAKILAVFLEEPTFQTLRTKEQLGYIVRGSMTGQHHIIFLSILVMSSSRDADYLEHRINEFIAAQKDTFNPTEEKLETIK